MPRRRIPLSRIADISGGYAFKGEDFANIGFPVVKIASIEPPVVNLRECERIPLEKVTGLDRFRLQNRDIVMAMTGATIGKVGRIRSQEIAYLNQRVAKISAKAGRDFDDFIFAILSQAGFDQEVLNNSTGSAQANVSTDGIGRILIPEFSPEEQLQIGLIFGTLDDKIELNRRMNETLEAITQAIFKSWFVDFDPVRAKAGGEAPDSICRRLGLTPDLLALFPNSFQESELEEIPKGWQIGNFGDVTENLRRSVQANELAPTSAYIGLEHMPRGSIALHEWGSAIELDSNKFAFRRKEILFGKLRPYFHKVGVAPVDGVCSTDILVLLPKEAEWFGFVLCHASSVGFVNYTNASSTGTKMPRTSWQEMARYPVLLPLQSVASAFTQRVSSLVERIITNIHEERLISALRDTLLPKLLSGELRI